MRVVIVGGGFGGVRLALKLANKKGFQVKLISDKNYFEYHAALYRSATGRSPLEVVIPLHDFFKFAENIEVIKDKITKVDATNNSIKGESDSQYSYDSLILAIGNVTKYYGINGLEKYSHGVKSINEALKLKRHLHEQLTSKKIEKNYVVIGAGATGIELAAELKAYIRTVRRRHKVSLKYNVTLIEAAARPVASLPERFSDKIEKRLRSIGLNLHFDTAVKGETFESLKLPSGEINTNTVVWTAGVANNPLFAKHPEIFRLNKNGKVEIDEYLSINNNIYVIGDSAATKYSGMAQTALYDANFIANNLLRQNQNKSRQHYIAKKPVYAIPVGSRWAAVLWGKVELYGRIGWIVRRAADLKLYLTFLPFKKALTAWQYGFVDDEACSVCKK